MGLDEVFQKIKMFCEQNGFTLTQAACVLLAVVGGVYLLRRLRFGRKPIFSPHKLRISESKSLGNRQFLLVVTYEDEKLLLGVYPNGMQFLCKLGTDRDSLPPKEDFIKGETGAFEVQELSN